jgi:hypothetical protein
MKPFNKRVAGGFFGSVTILETKSFMRGAAICTGARKNTKRRRFARLSKIGLF